MPYLILAIVIVVFITTSYFNKKIKAPKSDDPAEDEACAGCKITSCWKHQSNIAQNTTECPQNTQEKDE